MGKCSKPPNEAHHLKERGRLALVNESKFPLARAWVARVTLL
jgi:hypothetical protein